MPGWHRNHVAGTACTTQLACWLTITAAGTHCELQCMLLRCLSKKPICCMRRCKAPGWAAVGAVRSPCAGGRRRRWLAQSLHGGGPTPLAPWRASRLASAADPDNGGLQCTCCSCCSYTHDAPRTPKSPRHVQGGSRGLSAKPSCAIVPAAVPAHSSQKHRCTVQTCPAWSTHEVLMSQGAPLSQAGRCQAYQLRSWLSQARCQMQ